MKLKKSQVYNIIFLVIIILLIVPQTRKSIQIGINQVKALFGPSISSNSEKETLNSYELLLKDDQGNIYDFNRAQNEVVFVNLWATWCPPCIAELPSMEKLYSDYGDRVKFLFVSNEEQSRVQKFLQRKEMTIPSYQPQNQLPEQLYSKSIPATFIIGKDGTIHVDERGAANWNSGEVRDLLDRLLAE
jgi:thiol-disulfide isomerase/thioredoxin